MSGTGAAFDVQGGSAAGYITKWGAAEEVALGGKKKGRGTVAPVPTAGRLC